MNITNEYLSTLEAGTFDVELLNYGGELFKASFVVEEVKVENPETGDNILVYSLFTIISLFVLTTIIVFKNFFS